MKWNLYRLIIIILWKKLLNISFAKIWFMYIINTWPHINIHSNTLGTIWNLHCWFVKILYTHLLIPLIFDIFKCVYVITISTYYSSFVRFRTDSLCQYLLLGTWLFSYNSIPIAIMILVIYTLWHCWSESINNF